MHQPAVPDDGENQNRPLRFCEREKMYVASPPDPTARASTNRPSPGGGKVVGMKNDRPHINGLRLGGQLPGSSAVSAARPFTPFFTHLEYCVASPYGGVGMSQVPSASLVAIHSPRSVAVRNVRTFWSVCSSLVPL